MSLVADSPTVLARFDEIMAVLASKARGMTMTDLSVAHALARAFDSEDRDEEKVGDLLAKIGLTEDELRG